MSSVLVVVIVGVIIVAIAAASIADGPKPATPDDPPRRDPEPTPDPPVWQPPELPGPEPDLAPAPEPRERAAHLREEDPVDERGFWWRLRATVLLALAVVVLGSGAAGLIGGLVYVGAHVINQALG